MNGNFGEGLRRKRKAKKLTIVELSDRIGIAQRKLVRLELGLIEPTSKQKRTIESALVT